MPPFTESSLPPIPPEQRPERLLAIDTTLIDGNYVNAAYKWFHQVARRECELDAEVLASGSHYLILLQAPMLVTCIHTGWSFRAMAGVLHVGADHLVNGWMISSHKEGRETFDLLTNPEKTLDTQPEPRDDGPDYEPEEE